MNNLQGIRVAFFGTPDFALETLKKLKEYLAEVSFVVTQPSKRSGRGQKKKFSMVYEWAIKNKIKVYTPIKIDKNFFAKVIKKYTLDFIIVVAYGQIINEDILKYPKFMCLNVHASLLPKWRGAAPIQRAILNGDEKTGVSIMRVEKKLDSGPILNVSELKIEKKDNSGVLHDNLGKLGSDLLIKTIFLIIKNKHDFLFQKDDEATYAKKIEKTETRINWNNNAEHIDRCVKAFSPWPGAWTTIKGKENIRLKILDCELIQNYKCLINAIGFCDNNLVVKCGKSFLKIKKIQKEGKKTMGSKEFLNGYKIKRFFFI